MEVATWKIYTLALEPLDRSWYLEDIILSKYNMAPTWTHSEPSPQETTSSAASG